MTFHPPGGRGSSQWFHGDDWLAFNMIQSGHGYDHPNYERIAADYGRKPPKPCLDGEPGYEDHPVEFNPKNGYLDAYDARSSPTGPYSPGPAGTPTAVTTFDSFEYFHHRCYRGG